MGSCGSFFFARLSPHLPLIFLFFFAGISCRIQVVEHIAFIATVVHLARDIQSQIKISDGLLSLIQSIVRASQTTKRSHLATPITHLARNLQILFVKLYDLMHWTIGNER